MLNTFVVKWLFSREKTARKILMESQTKLEVLYRQPNYNEAYLLAQWSRQREQQLCELAAENSATLRSKLTKLVGLEEDLRKAELSTYLLNLYPMQEFWLKIVICSIFNTKKGGTYSFTSNKTKQPNSRRAD